MESSKPINRLDPSTLDRRIRAAQIDRNIAQRSKAAAQRARPLVTRPFAALAMLATAK